MAKYSRNAASVTSKKNPAKSQGGAQPTRPINKGTATAAVVTLALRLASTCLHRQIISLFDLLIGPAEAPSPPLEFEQCLEKFLFPKIGP